MTGAGWPLFFDRHELEVTRSQAVMYQIVIMFLIAAGTSLGTFSVVLLGYRRMFNRDHQFLYQRIVRRG